MAYQRNPNDPPHGADPTSEQIRNDPIPEEIQADPELAEGSASSSRVAIFAIGIAIILGVVFYGLNNSTMNPNTMTPTTSTATNTQHGVTTGAAPAQPQQQPAPGRR